jgi:hypothetical protein
VAFLLKKQAKLTGKAKFNNTAIIDDKRVEYYLNQVFVEQIKNKDHSPGCALWL